MRAVVAAAAAVAASATARGAACAFAFHRSASGLRVRVSPDRFIRSISTTPTTTTTPTTAMKTVTVDLISDFNCPFCYIGARRLEQAIASVERGLTPIRVDLRLHPFFLAPNMTEQTIDRQAYLRAKFGPMLEVRMPGMLQSAASSGIKMKPFPPLAPPTRAFRLLAWLDKHHPDKSHATTMELFKALWEDEQDLLQPDVLVACAKRAGLTDPDDLASLHTLLSSTRELEDDVRAEAQRWSTKVASGVPHFILNGATTITGAQDTSTFVRALERAAEAS